MFIRKLSLLAVLAGALLAPGVYAQESGPLIDALIRKGIITNQEAEDLRADMVREGNVIPSLVSGGGKNTNRLSLGMRIQTQYANLDTNINGAAFGPVATQHVLLRRMYLTLKAGVGGDWGAVMTYDFASGGYDDAIIEWKPTPDLSFNFGLRKVNVVYEERSSSGNLKSLERSGVTRYFVEGNNGRRLGAASYRLGAFLDGKKELNAQSTFIYSAAVTNPERNESFTLSAAAGDATNNTPAFWGNVGLQHKLPNLGLAVFGVSAGYLPDQGGNSVAALGRGFDLNLYTVFADVTSGRFGFMGEYMTAKVEGGVSATRDASPKGFYLQPSYLLTDTIEAVVRYQSLDTDGRGVNISDVVRSAGSGGVMNKFSGWYAGTNWYLKANDLKLQLGVEWAKTKDTVAGAPAEAKAVGVRSQMQIQF